MKLLLLALLLGGCLTFGFAPYDQWYVVPFALTLWLLLLAKAPRRFAGRLGFAFGMGWFGAGVSWVYVSIHQFGGMNLFASAGLVALLCAYLAIYPALFSWLLKRYVSVTLWPLAAPAIWLFCEWLRSWMLTGFPWLSLGYSQISGPLSGWLPVIGETGVSALVMVLSCSMLLLWQQRQRPWPGLLLIAVLLVSGVTLNQISWQSKITGHPKVSLVQGNIKQEIRWVPQHDRPTMQRYWDMTQRLWQSDIIIWPEAAIPKLEPLAQDYLHKLDEKAAATHTGLITGILNYNFTTDRAYNAMIGLGSREAEDVKGQYMYNGRNRYYKHHLLPIGEFIPFEHWLRNLAPIFNLPMSSFSRGHYLQPDILAKGYSLTSALCYEIAFPRQLRDNLKPQTNFILTVSDDAWFGHSHGPFQHLQIAQVRAKEFALPVLRATNNGLTALIDQRGNIIAQAPQFKQTTLTHRVTVATSMTPYRRFGDSLIWFAAILGLLLAVGIQRKKSKGSVVTTGAVD